MLIWVSLYWLTILEPIQNQTGFSAVSQSRHVVYGSLGQNNLQIRCPSITTQPYQNLRSAS